MLRRKRFFVDSIRLIVNSVAPAARTFRSPCAGTRIGECPLASSEIASLREFVRGRSKALIGSGVIEARVASRERPAIAALLSDFALVARCRRGEAERLSAIMTLAHSRQRGRARRRAEAFAVPLLLLGDGLLRAPPRWAASARLLSATAQRMTGPNSAADVLDPGRLLATRGWESPELLQRAARARRELIARRLGGAWWGLEADSGLPQLPGFALIIADETNGFGTPEPPSDAVLRAMLAAARLEVPPQRIVLFASNSGGRAGPAPRFLSEAASQGCAVVTQAVAPWPAIERAGCIYVAGGETGFLALLAGAKVRCFADSFYSGWGLTVDDVTVLQRPFRRTIDEVFAGACLLATRHLDPYHLKPASFEDTLEIVGEWRKIAAVNRRIAVCVGMSFWKRRQVADFLRSADGAPKFRRTTTVALARARARPGGAIAVWASRIPARLADAAERHHIPLLRVEDGFIRSVGLGSDFMPAASLVLDSRGMHYDPRVCSDLEQLLREAEFDPELIARARALIAQLVVRGVTKYNLVNGAPSIEWPAGKRRILVSGQVEDDLSVRLGGDGVSGNLDLLTRVRAANPDACILYKPHPDVEAGHRVGRIADAVVRRFADVVVRDVSTAVLLAEIDELHTLTSLSGFEALLRGRRVVVYGRPFYAGWGLTTDLTEIDRGRRLALEELVAGALILYPRYLDPVTRLPCGPELVIERLEDPALWRPGLLVLARRLQGLAARGWAELAAKRGIFANGHLRLPRNDAGTSQF